VVISESPNVHMLLRELLKSYQWQVVESTSDTQAAVHAINQGQAYVLIVDDTPEFPVVQKLRYLLNDSLAVTTPTICFITDTHKHEKQAVLKMGRPGVVEKPLTPSKFIPGFTNLIKRWESEPYLTLRKANYQFLNGNEALGIKIMLKLKEIEVIRHICSQSLAIHLRKLNKVKEAEDLLLSALKRSPRDLGTMIALGDLYMHTAMPHLAHRLFLGAKTAYGQSMAASSDLVQSAIFTSNNDLAIEYLYQMYRGEFQVDTVSLMLAKLLFSEGREQEAEKILNNNRAIFKRVQSSWNLAEQSAPEAVAS
jgi:DNA-binding NarL/FixJ family response regulator